MMTFRSKRKFSRVVLAAAVGMAVVAGSAGTGAYAADDGEDELLDVKIFRGILKGLGLRKDEASIDYRERSPLVLPPSKELPPPDTAAAAKAKTAGWPDDPDVKRVKQRRDAERNRKPFTEGTDDRPLMPSEYNIKTAGGNRAGEAPAPSIEQTSKPSTAAELGSKNIFSRFWAPKEEYTTFAGEPERSSLTEPPKGYRTPSPSQPYGVGKERWTAPVIDRNEAVR
jgi:hypothetical protein